MKELQNLVAVIFAALTLLTAGCATPSFHPGNVQASEEDKAMVKAGKWNRNASAQFAMGRINPETGERDRLDPKDVTVVLQTAVTCQEHVVQVLPGPGQSVFKGAVEGGIVGAVSTATGYGVGYTRQIMPDKSNLTLGAELGAVIGGLTGAYNGYTRDAYEKAKEIASCLKQVSAQNKKRPIGMYILETPNGQAFDAPLPFGLDENGVKQMTSQ